MPEEKKKPFQWLTNIFEITWTLLKNTSRIWELARFEFHIQYRDSRLGLLWAILTPLTRIGVYWFVFGVGLRTGADRQGYPYIVWLVCGVSAWSYISRGILGGAAELRAKKGLIAKIDIPPYLILASKELALLMEHVMLLVIMFVIIFSNKWRPDFYAANLIYYIFCVLCFSFAAAAVFSALSLIAADFQRLLDSVMRLMFFLSPIFWSPGDNLPAWFYQFLFINPIYYIITGYRNSLLFHQNFWERSTETVAFWLVTLLFYIYGCQWQSRIHEEMADFI